MLFYQAHGGSNLHEPFLKLKYFIPRRIKYEMCYSNRG